VKLGTLRFDPPVIMGILNVTPDSFSDGGRFIGRESALRRVREMIAEGAQIIDVGGESTRPGAQAVSVEEELERVIPVIEAVRSETDVPISIDTSKPAVMRAAVEAGANIVNDVRALREPGALETVAGLGVPVCLMHMRGEPRTMQQAPRYDDVVAEVLTFLEARAAACEAAGIPRERIILDPGFGFGKTLEHNLALFRALPRFAATGMPVLVGVSRKSMIGQVLEVPVDERLAGSLALATLAVWLGAAIVRSHDVRETVHAVRMTAAVRGASPQQEG